MKNKPTLSTIAVLVLIVFFVLGCQLSSQAEPTSTPAPVFTSTPANTPTPTVSPTPTPKPDLSSAVLKKDDLPAGFEELSLDELGISMSDFDSEGFQPEEAFAFLNAQELQFVIGFNFLLAGKTDRVTFDLGVSKPDITLPAMVKGMGSDDVRDEKLLEGIEDIGEKQIGMTMVTNMQDIPMQVDILMFRRDMIGTLLMSMTLEGETPNITIHDLGSKLDQHVQDTLQTLK